MLLTMPLDKANARINFFMLTLTGKGLEDGDCCPACLSAHCYKLMQDDHELEGARQFYAFLDACVAAVVQERSDEETSALRTKLESNRRNCATPSEHILYADWIQDPLHLYVDALYAALWAGMTRGDRPLIKRLRPHKGMRDGQGLWPLSFDELFPHGDQRVAAHVDWCAAFVSDSAILVFNVLLMACRPRVWPHVMARGVRERIVWTSVRLLLGDLHTPLHDWPGPEPCALPADRGFPPTMQGRRNALASILPLLGMILAGPDHKLDDMVKLVSGFEAVLFRAVQDAITVLDHRQRDDKDDFELLQKYALLLQRRLGYPDFLLEPRVRRWKCVHRPWETLPSNDLLMASFFSRQVLASACAAPGCDKVVQGTETGKAFAQCGKCGCVSYCSRECQTRDWKEGFPCPLPEDLVEVLEAAPFSKHKTICPIISRIRAATAFPLTEEDFETAIASTHLTRDERKAVVMWIVSRHVLPARAAAHLLGLVCNTSSTSHGTESDAS